MSAWNGVYDESECHIAECGTDYHSPCCEGHGVYAHFLVKPDGSETLCGFQCTGCNADFDVSEKDEFET